MTNSLAEIQQSALKNAERAVQERKKEVLRAWKVVFLMEKTAEEKGILALEEIMETIRQRKVPHYELLKAVIQLLVDGT